MSPAGQTVTAGQARSRTARPATLGSIAIAAFCLQGAAAFSAENEPAEVKEEPARTKDPEQMVAQYGCGACHAIETTGVGPSYMQIAAKYKDQPGAATRLKTRIRNGGSGVWGSVPMPPSRQIPSYELNEITRWILAME